MPAFPCASSSSRIQLVESPANPTVKHCVRLRIDARYRLESGRVLIPGEDVLVETQKQPHGIAPPQVLRLFAIEDDRLVQWEQLCEQRFKLSVSAMQKMTGLQTVPAAQLAAEVAMPAKFDLRQWRGGTLVKLLVLDGVQDPGNMGSMLRTAHALGWQAVFLLPGCCDIFNDKALRASKGACFKLPVASGGWDELDASCEKHGLIKLAAESDEGRSRINASSRIADDSRSGVALVIGSEGQGLSRRSVESCLPVSIPMQGTMESLNASHAGAILMFMLSDGWPELAQRLAELKPIAKSPAIGKATSV